MTVECLACQTGVTPEVYCARNPQADGCVSIPPPVTTPEPGPICCEAQTAHCLACQTGVTVEVFCANNPGAHGCPTAPPPTLPPPTQPPVTQPPVTQPPPPATTPYVPPAWRTDCKACTQDIIGCTHYNADDAWCRNNCIADQTPEWLLSTCGHETGSGTHCYCGTVELHTEECRACTASDGASCTHHAATSNSWCENNCQPQSGPTQITAHPAACGTYTQSGSHCYCVGGRYGNR